MGVKQWSIDKCTDAFVSLCNQAFTDREFAGIVGLEQMATGWHGSKFKTTPLHNALSDSLGKDILFGGKKEQNPEHAIHVAVTSTSGTGKEAVMMSNYCRPPEMSDEYEFVRSDGPEFEMQVWQAAAATSSAPGYFKPFYNHRTNQTYMDGGLCYNNPINVANRERQLLWPDVANHRPDLLLSIGTGTNSMTIEQQLSKGPLPATVSSQ